MDGYQFRGVETEILPHFQMHTIDLREEPRDRHLVVHRIGLHLAEMSNLGLKPRDSIERALQLLVVGDHGDSGMISTIPRWPPPRLACQYSMVSCSLPRAASRL